MRILDAPKHYTQPRTYSSSIRIPRQTASNIELDAKNETATFTFTESVPVGASGARFTVRFTGVHNEKMAGFYRSQYIDQVTKDQKHMVVTQFEPTGRVLTFNRT